MYHVYILESLQNGSYYKGQTDDLERRLAEHNRGEERATSRYIPWKLIWVTERPTRSEALVLEKKLKNITGRDRLMRFIEKHGRVGGPDEA
jgi:putative endonuclease